MGESSFVDDRAGADSDHKWVILISVIIINIISFFALPMRWVGYLVEFMLNLLSLNGGLINLFFNILQGKIALPRKDTRTFISTIGHLDDRIDLQQQEQAQAQAQQHITGADHYFSSSSCMEYLCIMSSKLAYENVAVVKDVIINHWKMHFVGFYDCWNDYQKRNTTQVFILCDKPQDANLILISFRGTEFFCADDWITDFDISWYDLPNNIGRIHRGFVEAMGLGDKTTTSTNVNNINPFRHQPRPITSIITAAAGMDQNNVGAFYKVGNELNRLLSEHKRAKFVVTGHSLGGALAILFPTLLAIQHQDEETHTHMLNRLFAVYTFGQPRIGDENLGKFVEATLNKTKDRYFRVVYSDDIVPRLPYDDDTFLFKHFGLCIYYDSFYREHQLQEEPNRNYFGIRYIIPMHLNAAWELLRALLMGYIYGADYKEGWFSIWLRLLGLLLPGLSAHSPRNYINSIRLARRDI